MSACPGSRPLLWCAWSRVEGMTAKPWPTVIVGIPAHNEEQAIADIVARSLPHASTVVVVDDGSRDCTAANAVRAGAIVLRHEANFGKGAAVATLFEYAIRHQADALV